MAIYFYWGEDDFLRQRAVEQLRDRTLDPQWMSFNYDKILADQPDAVIQGLNQAMTPPFGLGNRLVWLADTTVGQRCSEQLLTELSRTLPTIPAETVLLFTTRAKPDGRLKSTKLLKQYAEVKEFSPIPPWKTEQLIQQVRQVAHGLGVKLSPEAVELVAESVGNDGRQLHHALEKLRLYGSDRSLPPETPLDIQAPEIQAPEIQAPEIQASDVRQLVRVSTQNSLQLAAVIRQGNTTVALDLVLALTEQNEPPLRILATLVGQFRTWLWVKLMVDAGERDQQRIARAADIRNPKRIYFIQKEVASLTLAQLRQTLPLLLDLELRLKQGADPVATLQTSVIELCQLFTCPAGAKP